ncbi:hypothetical protein HQ529_03515 [Candidatus Woesearchaeota archaeon]|nr:hypothetical protein [Candidatus Woesearchaeota archaeon]
MFGKKENKQRKKVWRIGVCFKDNSKLPYRECVYTKSVEEYEKELKRMNREWKRTKFVTITLPSESKSMTVRSEDVEVIFGNKVWDDDIVWD